jgi:ferric-dicitrate binding protein FerR (iron transport regulator)
MQTTPEHIEYILIKALQKTATPDEERLLNQWLGESQENLEQYCQMQEIWDTRDMPAASPAGWERLQAKIEKETKQHHTLPAWTRYAVAACTGALIAIATTNFISKETKAPEAITRNVVFSHSGVEKVILPDSSTAWLNGKSKLAYPEKFKADNRIVTLEGKSFFDIRKNTASPFIVRTAKIDVVVTGTSFFVETEAKDKTIVTLITGGVSINIKNDDGATLKTHSLTPGQQIDYNKNSHETTIANVETALYCALKEGTYRFDNETLDVIAQYLTIYFETPVIIAPSLKSKRFTGRITPELSIRDVIEIINKSHPVTTRIEKDSVYIMEKR